MKSRYLIYALIDPITNKVRYIGRSTSGLTRPKSHMCPSMLKATKSNKNLTKKQAWIKGLLNKGKKPVIKVLQYLTSESQLNDTEIYFISQYKNLTNLTLGGGGMLGNIPWNKGKKDVIKNSTRKKMSLAKKGKSPWNKGIKMNKEQKEKIKDSFFKKGKIPHNSNPVICNNSGEVFRTTGEAARKYGTRATSINRVCTGERNTYKGLSFSYITNKQYEKSKVDKEK